MSQHPNAIDVADGGGLLTGESHEIMRVWATNGAGSSVWINANVLEDPEMFGYLMADTIRHAARAYAREANSSEDEALSRIVDMFEAEIARPTDQGNTTPRSQQGH